jgi:hypothetical protein
MNNTILKFKKVDLSLEDMGKRMFIDLYLKRITTRYGECYYINKRFLNIEETNYIIINLIPLKELTAKNLIDWYDFRKKRGLVNETN